MADLQCGDAETYILTVNERSTKNDLSLVNMIEYNDFRIVFSGDATGDTQDGAMDNFAELEVTVLTGSHHGADTEGSNEPPWADKTKPEVMIYTTGLSHKHPRCPSVKRYRGTLKAAKPHAFHCGEKNQSYMVTETSELAEFATEVSGVVTVTKDGTTYSIHCSRSDNCGLAD